MLTISFILVAFLINCCPFRWSTNVVCELILRPMNKWHLYTCSYAYIWYIKHRVPFSLGGSNTLCWMIAALTGKQWVWSIFVHSPVQYGCSSWWHSTMRSSSLKSLHLAWFLVHFLLIVKLFALQLLYRGWELFGWK